MASNFPAGIDTFTNPVYTKIDGEDVVSAAHVNDLQDAIRAVQEVVAGAGLPIDFDSNNYIADDTSYKVCLEALDAQLGTSSGEFAAYKAFVLVSDPVQHHSNVIEVTAIGNLSSSRVQPALEEHQSDIDNIMTGGTVEGLTLDDRYAIKTAPVIFDSSVTVSTDLTVEGNTILGNAGGDTVTVFDAMTVGGTLEVTGNLTLDAGLLVQAGQKIAEEGATNDSYILFGTDKLEFYTHKDFIIRLDADDATDALSDDGKFSIRNGLDAEVLFVEEDGSLTTVGDVVCANVDATAMISVGTLDITEDKFDFGVEGLHVQLDKDDLSGTARFFVTQDGDTGGNLASVDLLMNLDETSTLVTGVHKLKSGIQETGYFGLKIRSDNAGGEFHGMGVNFKTVLTNSPSSVTLTVDDSNNYSNLSVTNMSQYGFFFEFDTVAAGAAHVRGTYDTIGN